MQSFVNSEVNNYDKLDLRGRCPVKEDNINYWGKDLPGKNKIVNGFQECVNYCRTVPECKYWTYNTFIRRCYLKFDDWNRSAHSNSISGNRNCVAGK